MYSLIYTPIFCFVCFIFVCTSCTKELQALNIFGKGMCKVQVKYPLPSNSYSLVSGTKCDLNTTENWYVSVLSDNTKVTSFPKRCLIFQRSFSFCGSSYLFTTYVASWLSTVLFSQSGVLTACLLFTM